MRRNRKEEGRGGSGEGGVGRGEDGREVEREGEEGNEVETNRLRSCGPVIVGEQSVSAMFQWNTCGRTSDTMP